MEYSLMATSIEQFTAPGKYYYELTKESIEAQLKIPVNNLFVYYTLGSKSKMINENPYYKSFKSRKK